MSLKMSLNVPQKEKRSYEIFVTPRFSVWTSLGLNQGPPDYESVKVRFFKISQNISLYSICLFIRYLLILQPKQETLWNLKKRPLVFAWCSQGVREIKDEEQQI